MRAEDGVARRETGNGKRTARIVLRVLIGTVLFATAVGKLLDVRGFARVLGTYRAFDDLVLLPIAIAVPVAELLLAVWLFSSRRPFAAALAALAMHLAYAAWSAGALHRGLQLPNCGCFGVFLPRRLSWSTVVEDLVLAGACATIAGLSPRRPSLEPA